MTLAVALAVVLFAGLVAYAVLGGADFGSGVWDLTAGGDRRGAPTRALVDHAIGPVWEANHVWLIFVLVLLWGGFPSAFTTLMQEAGPPLWFAAFGIALRGSAFAFRKVSPTLSWARAAGITFAVSSLVTPFFLGAVAGLVASGRIGTGRAGGWAWLNPTSVVGGVLAVATCTFLAGVFLAAEADALGLDRLRDELRTKSLIGGVITGLIALSAIPVLAADSPTLVDGLTGRGAPVVVASGIAGLATLEALRRGRLRAARPLATLAVIAVVSGWGVAQYPWMLVDAVEIDDAAGARSSLVALLVASGLGLCLVLPAVAWLLRLADRNDVGYGFPVEPRAERGAGGE